jgi:hypothetical protein
MGSSGSRNNSRKKIFLIEVDDRTSETLKNVFAAFLLPRSIVYTDGWAA